MSNLGLPGIGSVSKIAGVWDRRRPAGWDGGSPLAQDDSGV